MPRKQIFERLILVKVSSEVCLFCFSMKFLCVKFLPHLAYIIRPTDSNFENADFSNAIVDRASFKGSSLKGAIFTNTVLTGTSFEGANVENADFTDAAIGIFDLRNLCKNPTLSGENPTTGSDTRASAGCQ